MSTSTETLPIKSAEDVVRVRQVVRTKAAGVGLSIVDQTKIITAASEIARNTLDYGGGGEVAIESVKEQPRTGVRLIFRDNGPGIPDIEQAMRDNFTTGSGLGLGLGGAKRLCTDFSIQSKVGSGTTIMLARWK
ncbi:MAG: anti-sigma regulatory factor [Alphaproteobacteria bacterium]|nr:anti-sigma regulatory factor [Alphaproteobacteria bacterium]